MVGEAAKQLGADSRACCLEVARDDAGRTRDRLVHHDFDIDLDVLWVTVTLDLPRLLATLI